jgi:hypothetical protein
MPESTNAAFVRRTYELVNAGDLETMVKGFEPGFEWHPDELAPGQTTRRTADDIKLAVDDFTTGGGATRYSDSPAALRAASLVPSRYTPITSFSRNFQAMKIG